MASVSVIGSNQLNFVNQQNVAGKIQSVTEKTDENEKPIEVVFVKSGDSRTQKQAEDVFQRANAFADLSMQAKRMVTGYAKIELEASREQFSQLLGVDIYV